MSFDTALLDILCCPVTRLPLQRMPVHRAERIGMLIAERKVLNRGGQAVEGPVSEWLMTRDGKLAYPMRDGIPVLIEDEAVELAKLND